ncbi:MAG: ester cyclase [Acidimicrobiia bacterium]|nr:ester cyclase [Acidimicrobiia bacterium]
MPTRRTPPGRASHASILREANDALIVNGDTDAIGTFFSADYVVHLTDQDMIGGHTMVRRVLDLYRRAFSGIAVELEILAEDGERVAWQRTLRATHSGSFKGFPGTGRPIVWREMVVSRFENGLVAEDWFLTDLAERLLLARKR